MADWKYVMYEANGQLVPILFPNDLIHAKVDEYVGYAIREHVIAQRPHNWSSKLMSAGFVSGMVVTGVHGRSESLDNLISKPTDAAVMNCWPYEHGRESVMPDVEKMVLLRTIELLIERVKGL